jgi:hypothetical protein
MKKPAESEETNTIDVPICVRELGKRHLVTVSVSAGKGDDPKYSPGYITKITLNPPDGERNNLPSNEALSGSVMKEVEGVVSSYGLVSPVMTSGTASTPLTVHWEIHFQNAAKASECQAGIAAGLRNMEVFHRTWQDRVKACDIESAVVGVLDKGGPTGKTSMAVAHSIRVGILQPGPNGRPPLAEIVKGALLQWGADASQGAIATITHGIKEAARRDTKATEYPLNI